MTQTALLFELGEISERGMRRQPNFAAPPGLVVKAVHKFSVEPWENIKEWTEDEFKRWFRTLPLEDRRYRVHISEKGVKGFSKCLFKIDKRPMWNRGSW